MPVLGTIEAVSRFGSLPQRILSIFGGPLVDTPIARSSSVRQNFNDASRSTRALSGDPARSQIQPYQVRAIRSRLPTLARWVEYRLRQSHRGSALLPQS